MVRMVTPKRSASASAVVPVRRARRCSAMANSRSRRRMPTTMPGEGDQRLTIGSQRRAHGMAGRPPLRGYRRGLAESCARALLLGLEGDGGVDDHVVVDLDEHEAGPLDLEGVEADGEA